MRYIKLVLIILLALFLVTSCKHLPSSAEAGKAAFQISANGVDAAEPATASAPDGTFYVAWVNHDAKQSDVMLARFNNEGQPQGAAVRVNSEAGVATAWRGDQPSLAVAPDGAVYVLWTARVSAGEEH